MYVCDCVLSMYFEFELVSFVSSSVVEASYTNEYELITRCLFLFKVGCINSTRYLDVSSGIVPSVDTMVFIG